MRMNLTPAPTVVLPDAVVPGVLHVFQHIIALRMCGKVMEILAFLGIRLRVNQERRIIA